MQKKTDIFLDKFVKKNYNNELEEVIEKKFFDENAKNLLLSSLYKIKAAYKDYECVKRNVEPMDEFIEDIIFNIQNNCNEIKLVKPHSEESKIIGDRTFLVDKKNKKIICYPIERKLMYSIAKTSKKDKIIKEDYFIIDKTLSDLINVGKNIDTIEPIRDFNGYSWTTISREIESIDHNVIYQNLRILVGYKFLDNWIKNNEYIIDYMEMFENRLEELYGREISEKLLNLLKEISVLMGLKFNENLRNELLKIKDEVQRKLEVMNDNAKFIQTLTEQKRQLTKEIKNIDEAINNKNILQKEYEIRNEKLPLKEKIFSIRILSKIMTEERTEKIERIEQINRLMIPQNFVKYKKELEEKEKYASNTDVKNVNEQINNLKIEFQKVFMGCYKQKIDKVQTKQEIVNLLYEFRYYNLLPITAEKNIMSQVELQEQLEEIGKYLIQKAHQLKALELISEEESLDFEILRNIFKVRIINLEELYIKISKEKDNFYLQIFDDNVSEEKIELNDMGNLNKKDLKIKIGKKIKIFN